MKAVYDLVVHGPYMEQGPTPDALKQIRDDRALRAVHHHDWPAWQDLIGPGNQPCAYVWSAACTITVPCLLERLKR